MLNEKIHSNHILQCQGIAYIAHGAIGQKRKYTNEPYYNHCDNVAKIIMEKVNVYILTKPDEDNTVEIIMTCAAYLHDVLEDTHLTADDLFCLNIPRAVIDVVIELTDISKPEDGNREARKKIDSERYTSASYEAKTVKCADLIDNTSSIVKYDKDFAKIYLREKELLLPYLLGADQNLHNMAATTLEKAKRELGINYDLS